MLVAIEGSGLIGVAVGIQVSALNFHCFVATISWRQLIILNALQVDLFDDLSDLFAFVVGQTANKPGPFGLRHSGAC
jgi:hypothetical protein